MNTIDMCEGITDIIKEEIGKNSFLGLKVMGDITQKEITHLYILVSADKEQCEETEQKIRQRVRDKFGVNDIGEITLMDNIDMYNGLDRQFFPSFEYVPNLENDIKVKDLLETNGESDLEWN